MEAAKTFEKKWIKVQLQELSDDAPDPGDCFLEEIAEFHAALKKKYPDHRFGIESDYDWIALFAERLETDEEFQKRKKDSLARSERMKRYHKMHSTRDKE